VGRDASGGAGGGACAWTEAPANSSKDRDNVATPNLTIIPFPRAKRRLAVTRVTGIRAVLRHAAHGPPQQDFLRTRPTHPRGYGSGPARNESQLTCAKSANRCFRVCAVGAMLLKPSPIRAPPDRHICNSSKA
jgi:hypothetical protein